MAQAAELAKDHHLVANCTDVLVFWNVSSCNIMEYNIHICVYIIYGNIVRYEVRYVMESSEDMEMLFSFNEVIRSELLQLKRCANYQEIIG